MKIQKLYRAVSQAKYDDWSQSSIFRTTRNTLEAKQFFKSHSAVVDFCERAHSGKFSPPYKLIIEVHVPIQCLEKLQADNMMLDTHEAISIDEEHLPDFNKCITFNSSNAI